MKALILKYLLLCLIILSCSDSIDNTDYEADKDTAGNSQNTIYDTPVIESINEEVIQGVLEEFSLLAALNPNRAQDTNAYASTEYPTTLAQTSKYQLNEDTEINCLHIIKNTINNRDYTFDLTNPITDEDIEDFLNSNVISITESETKYFTADMVPSTDCEMEKFNGPTPNHDEKDTLFRPTFYTYDSVFDFLGEHHHFEQFYIEKNEITFSPDRNNVISEVYMEGFVDKKIDRYHQVFINTNSEFTRSENLQISGFIEPIQNYRFYFMNGSSKYFSYGYTIQNEVEDPVFGNTIIDMTDRYVIQFYLRYIDAAGRVEGSFLVPFNFDITIDFAEIIEHTKNSESADYSKTTVLEIPTGGSNKLVGEITYRLNSNGEFWTVDSIENPIYITDQELEYIIENYN